MSVSEKQTVEIIKVLYRGADLLILDEPTAVLTPQEIEKFFNVLRTMKADGKSIIVVATTSDGIRIDVELKQHADGTIYVSQAYYDNDRCLSKEHRTHLKEWADGKLI